MWDKTEKKQEIIPLADKSCEYNVDYTVKCKTKKFIVNQNIAQTLEISACIKSLTVAVTSQI